MLPLFTADKNSVFLTYFWATQFQIAMYTQMNSMKQEKFLKINIQGQILYFGGVSKLSIPPLQTKYRILANNIRYWLPERALESLGGNKPVDNKLFLTDTYSCP